MKKISKNEQKSPVGRKTKLAILMIFILLILGTIWAFSGSGVDAQVEKVKKLQAEAFKEGLTPEQRRQQFDLVRQEMQQLSPEQRHQVFEGMRENFERRMDQQIKTYFSLPKEKRVAYLDNLIKEQEERRKQWEAQRGQNSTQRQNREGPPGPPPDMGPGPGGGPPGGGPGGRGGPGGGSPDERMQRRGQWLDRSTAEQRAMRSTFMADMRQRRIQLGLPAVPQPPQRPR